MNALGFFHSDGFVPAFKQATRYATTAGRVATMPDIVKARLAQPFDTWTWARYYTTLSAEYFGFSKAGVPIIIVAHGVGPMSKLSGIQAAYKHEYGDKQRNRRGGRISREEFLKLESGHYGDVAIVEFEPLVRSHEYVFYATWNYEQALNNTLLRARLGADWEAYLEHAKNEAYKWHEEERHFRQWDARKEGFNPHNPYIIRCEDAANCHYGWIDEGELAMHQLTMNPELALAHLLSIGGTNCICHINESRVPARSHDISCHEWWNGVRLVGVPTNWDGNILEAADPASILRHHWQELMRPVQEAPVLENCTALMKLGNDWFTQVQKKGAGLATWAPEYHVTTITRIDGPKEFHTPVHGYYGYFKYDERDVKAIMPQGANAYHMSGEPQLEGNGAQQVCGIDWYHIKADTSRRAPTSAEIENDFELRTQYSNQD